jgi:nitrous oxidase accessory protein NosD
MSNSTISATTQNPTTKTAGVGLSGGTVNADIMSSKISGSSYGIYKTGTATFRVGGSQIIGGHNGVPGTDKVVNSFDGNYNPIPNL